MNRKTKAILKLTLPLLLGVILVWYSLSKISVSELLQYFRNANYGWIGLGVFLGILSHLSRAYRWKFMIEPMGYNMRLPNSIMAVFAAYLVNYTVPRAGEITRATIIANYDNIPFEKGFGTIVAERVADLVVMSGIILLTLALEFDFIAGFFSERFDPMKLVLMVIVLVFFAIIGFIFIRRGKSGFAKRIRHFISGLLEGILSIFRMKQKWAFIFHTLFIWSMYVCMFYVTTFAVAEIEGIPFSAVLIGFIAASFSIAATNGGIGSYPVAIFAAFSIFNIAKEPSLAFGWIMWSSQTLMIVVLGGLSLIYLPVYNRLNRKNI